MMTFTNWLNRFSSLSTGCHAVVAGRKDRRRRLLSCPAQGLESLEDRRLLSAGDLDPTFGNGGKVVTHFTNGGSLQQAQAVAIQADGKSVVVGYGGYLARYNTDGTLDTSFGDGGQVACPFNATSVVIENYTGKIIVGGFSGDFELAKYNTDGTLDTSFDGDGRVTTNFGGFDRVTSLAIYGGRVVASGVTYNGSNYDFAVASYWTWGGSLDTNFSGDGKVVVNFGSAWDWAESLAIDSNGRMVIVGHTETSPNNYDFAVARLDWNGNLDSTFDNDGRTTVDFGNYADGANAVTIDSKGKIVVAGSGGDRFAVARFNTDGSLDTSFDGDGKLTTSFGGSSAGIEGMAIDHFGRIVVGGYAHNGTDQNFALARYNADGNLDTSFDGDGKLTTDFGGTHDFVHGLAVESNGKIVVVGESGQSQRDFALARYDAGYILPSRFAMSPWGGAGHEGNSGLQEITLTVYRTGYLGREASVGYVVTGSGDRPADASDFGGAMPSGIVTFGVGETYKTITIQVRGDRTPEAAENFLVTLTNPSVNDVIDVATATGTIYNDDFVDAVYVARGSSLLNASVVDGRLQVMINNVIDRRYDGIDPAAIRSLRITGGSRNDLIDLTNLSSAMYSHLGPISLNGGAGDDTILGSGSFHESITGGLGNDQLDGGFDYGATLVESANVTLLTLTDTGLTGLGTDRLANFFEARLMGGVGANTINAADFHGSTILKGGDGNDVLLGGQGGWNQLDGGAGNDVLTGGDSSDELIGGLGNDRLNGGVGGYDVARGGDGLDTLVATGASEYFLDDFTLSRPNDEVRHFQVEVVALTLATEITDRVGRIDLSNFTGGGINTLTGSNGGDELIGGSGRDLIKGLSGDDTLTGSWGNDTLDGGAGLDRIRERDDVNFKLTNTALTGLGTDSLIAMESAWLIGGESNNLLDALAFSLGNVTLEGGDGDDILLGGQKDDRLIGDRASDIDVDWWELPSTGRDILVGGMGTDELDGGRDEDILIGGTIVSTISTAVALNAIRAEWTSEASLADRQARLLNGGGLNGTNKLNSVNVKNDTNTADRLSGGDADFAESDWFFQHAGDVLVDFNAASDVKSSF